MVNIKLVLRDVEEEQKQQILWQHCEKLAIAFRLISTLPGTTLGLEKSPYLC